MDRAKSVSEHSEKSWDDDLPPLDSDWHGEYIDLGDDDCESFGPSSADEHVKRSSDSELECERLEVKVPVDVESVFETIDHPEVDISPDSSEVVEAEDFEVEIILEALYGPTLDVPEFSNVAAMSEAAEEGGDEPKVSLCVVFASPHCFSVVEGWFSYRLRFSI